MDLGDVVLVIPVKAGSMHGIAAMVTFWIERHESGGNRLMSDVSLISSDLSYPAQEFVLVVVGETIVA